VPQESTAEAEATPPRRARGRRPSLSAEAIVERAFDLVMREGTAALSIRRLGSELGADGTAVYRHFRDKDDLMLAVNDQVAAWVIDEARRRTPADASWQEVLRTFAACSWESAIRFPSVIALALGRTTGEQAEREIVELLLSTIARSGLPPRQAVLAYRSFADTLLGLIGMQAVVLDLPPDLKEKDETAWSRIYAHLPHERYPATQEHTAELLAVADEEVFHETVELVVSAIEARAAAVRSAE
jgi:AcrR family transcriptional regulator